MVNDKYILRSRSGPFPEGVQEIDLTGPYWPRDSVENLSFLLACAEGLRNAGYEVEVVEIVNDERVVRD